MRICAYVHGYPPDHCAGAEWMLHDTLQWLADRGHTCRVLNHVHTPSVGMSTYGTTTVFHRPAKEVTRDELRAADVILTHLDLTREALVQAKRARRPVVHLVHNHWQLKAHAVTDSPLVIFNSEHLAAEALWRDRQQSWIVVHPPVPERYVVKAKHHTGHVTLLNCNREKGGGLLPVLATREPRRSFLGVAGAYGKQVMAENHASNLSYQPVSVDVRDVYRETRIVLMPSSYESYGRVPVEAAWSGIPTVYTITPGILEGIGPAGLGLQPKASTRAWQGALKRLDRKSTYEWYSNASRERARFLWARSACELEALEEQLALVA